MNFRTRLWLVLLVVVVAAGVWYYRSSHAPAAAIPIGSQIEIAAPLGLPPVPFPKKTAATPEPKPD